MAKLSRDDLIDQIEDEFNSREWDLGDSGTYLDNLQAAVDSANEGDDSIDVREDINEDYYYDWVDCYKDLFGQIADGLLQNELIDWNDDNAVAKAIVDAVEYFDDDFHEIEDTWYDKKAQSIVDEWYEDHDAGDDGDWISVEEDDQKSIGREYNQMVYDSEDGSWEITFNKSNDGETSYVLEYLPDSAEAASGKCLRNMWPSLKVTDAMTIDLSNIKAEYQRYFDLDDSKVTFLYDGNNLEFMKTPGLPFAKQTFTLVSKR